MNALSEISRRAKSLARVLKEQDALAFTLTNRIPRRAVTQLMGRFSKIEQPLVRDASLYAWQLFADLELEDAAKAEFKSVHDCFIRELKPGARPIDPDPRVLVSPCDAIVGGSGVVRAGMLVQAKGLSYPLQELLIDPELADRYRDGQYATLRLTSSMYHRFHAPSDLRVVRVNHVSGDTWNTHPPALRRVDKLFCKNERAVVQTRLQSTGDLITLVPVAAILISGIRLHCVDRDRCLRDGVEMTCDASETKGHEMGWFEHGSTILVFAPQGYSLAAGVYEGARIRMGEALMRMPGERS
jgi:phosphatidylserine decarboxylase